MNKKNNTVIDATLYPDRALVTRMLEIDILPETEQVLFENLPSGIYRDTIRISGEGDALLRIEGIDIKDEYLEEVRDEDTKSLEKELEALNDECAAIDSNLDLCAREKEFISGLKDVSSSRLTGEFYFKKTAPEELGNMVSFFSSNYDRINNRIGQLNGKKRTIIKKISRVNRELENRYSLRSVSTINCHVSVNVEKPGKFSFYLTYVVDGAQWSPVYDARLYIDDKEIEISYYGQISQSTGEKWDEVTLYLSTARPSVSASLPEMEAWFIDFSHPGDMLPSPGNSTDMRMQASGAEPVLATVEQGLTVTFGIKDRQDLPPDGTDKKVLIARKRFPVELDYRACPEKTEAVFIIGNFENSADFPMLSGAVKVYHDRDYIGDSYLETVVPGEQVKLSLGIDESIKIKRELLKRFTRKKGVTGGNTRTVFRYRISVENYKVEGLDLLLEEVTPLSRDKDLKVVLTEEPKGVSPDYRGVLSWTIQLNPDDRKTIDIEYYVEFPKSREVVGIDV